MKEITVEVHPRTAEELAQEAIDRGYRNRSEYVRQLVLHRSVITSGPPIVNREFTDERKNSSASDTPELDADGELEEIEARFNAQLNELKQRVVALESELEKHTEHEREQRA